MKLLSQGEAVTRVNTTWQLNITQPTFSGLISTGHGPVPVDALAARLSYTEEAIDEWAKAILRTQIQDLKSKIAHYEGLLSQ